MLLKNLVAKKPGMNTVNDDQRNFVFDLMKGYNVSNFFKKSEIVGIIGIPNKIQIEQK